MSISEVVSISASTGIPVKVVLKAGAEYPNYYVLISPTKASATISAKELWINISGTMNVDDTTSAIVLEPNYLYSSRSKLVYEHSAVLRLEDSIVLEESNQSSFNNNSISLYIVKANFNSFATTESATLIFVPVSVGGRNLFNGNISFECFDEKTAEWWNSTLSEVYKNSDVVVSRNGNFVKIENLRNITLSIAVFEAYALASGELSFTPPPIEYRLVAITPQSFNVYLYSTVLLGAKVIDAYGNPVRGKTVVIYDPCNGNSQQVSDERGEVWYYFNASCVGSQTVTFTLNGESIGFDINVQQPSGLGGTFTLTWYNESGEPTDYEEWPCEDYECTKNFTLNVQYQGSKLEGVLVNFATSNRNVLEIVSANTTYTDSKGNATVEVRATNETPGGAYLIGIVGDSVKVLKIEVVTPKPLPDLSVTIEVEPSQPFVGQQVKIKATVSNIGNADAGEFNVAFYVNGDEIDNKTVPNLAAGSSTTLSTTWTPQSAGTYTIRVVADPDNKIEEKNESNNESSTVVTVNPLYLYLEVVHYGSPAQPYVNVNPPNQNCDGQFTYEYSYGTIVTLTAHPPGLFREWGGACANQPNPCKLTMDSNKKVFAYFKKLIIPTPIEIPTIPPPQPPEIQ